MSWKTVTFEDAPFEIIDGDRGKNYPNQSQLHEEGYCLFLSATNVTKDGFAFDSCQFVTQEKHEALRKGTVDRGDVVLTTRGTLGNVAYYSENVPFDPVRINSGMVTIKSDPQELLPPYVYYYLKSDLFQSQVKALQSGAAQPQLPIRDIKKIKFNYPDLPTQERIASILSAYDDLIENNRRRIALLEQAARLLYREWFVHFRFPGHETAKFVDGLPEGWRKTTISEISDFLSRGITPKYDPEAQSLIINQKCIRQNRVSLEPARRQSKIIPDLKKVRKYDVLVNSTGAGTLGRIAQNFTEMELLTVDSHVTIVRAVQGLDPFWFGQAIIAQAALIETLGRGATNQTELSKDDLGRVEITLPPNDIQHAYGIISGSTFQQIDRLMEANQKLIAARDLLLPRLMDGRISV